VTQLKINTSRGRRRRPHKVTIIMDATRPEAGAISVGTGLTDSTHSSTSSASGERYRLDHEDTSPILLYTYRGKLETSSQKDLCALLDKGMQQIS